MESISAAGYAAITILFIWNLFLSVYIFSILNKYKKLTKGTTNQNLEQVVLKLINHTQILRENVSNISQNLTNFQNSSTLFLQKLSIIRFNPFEDSGGDQSFAFAVMDGNGNGVIISSLHSRQGTRVYAKELKNGKSQSHSLTKEEKEALEKALRRK